MNIYTSSKIKDKFVFKSMTQKKVSIRRKRRLIKLKKLAIRTMCAIIEKLLSVAFKKAFLLLYSFLDSM